jgi:predicted O-linked N-acetylglucosamine transferase (SPINDLY family)
MSAAKSKLTMARQASRFFDTRAFVRSMEEALQAVWERHEAGLVPADIKVVE